MTDPAGNQSHTPRRTRTKALVLAAGLGTRLRPITHHTPKCLVPIADRPLLEHWCDRFESIGLTDVLINNHHLPDQLRRFIARKNATGRFHLREAYEPALLGSAGTIAANPRFADDADDVLIVYADNFSNVELADLLAFHRSHPDPFTMMLYRSPEPERCGIAALDSDQRIVHFVEKPQKPTGNLANAGLYVLTADAYRHIAAMNAFDIAYDIIPQYINHMRGWIFDGYHRDIGNLEALARVRADAPALLADNLTPRGARP